MPNYIELYTQALIDATSSGSDLEEESGIRMVALFDHEEVGSNSAQGAGSPVMIDAMSHITSCFSSDTKVANHSSYRQTEIMLYFTILLSCAHYSSPHTIVSSLQVLKKAIQKSLLVSADMAHALHPNFMVII